MQPQSRRAAEEAAEKWEWDSNSPLCGSLHVSVPLWLHFRAVKPRRTTGHSNQTTQIYLDRRPRDVADSVIPRQYVGMTSASLTTGAYGTLHPSPPARTEAAIRSGGFKRLDSGCRTPGVG